MNITGIAVAVTLAVVVALGFLFFGPGVFTPFNPRPAEAIPADQDLKLATSTNQLNSMDQTNSQSAGAQPGAAPQALPTELTVSDEVVGTGTEAKSGDTVSVNYVGMLPDGTVFDSSKQRGPFQFTLGAGQVIQGWDKGVVGMKVGGKRQLIIPPGMAYGSQGAGSAIPPNATLIFEVEMVKVGS